MTTSTKPLAAAARWAVAALLTAFVYLVLWRDKPLFGWKWAARRHTRRMQRHYRQLAQWKAHQSASQAVAS